MTDNNMHVWSGKHANCFPRVVLISSLCKLQIAWGCVGGDAGSTSARDATVPMATHHLPFWSSSSLPLGRIIPRCRARKQCPGAGQCVLTLV